MPFPHRGQSNFWKYLLDIVIPLFKILPSFSFFFCLCVTLDSLCSKLRDQNSSASKSCLLCIFFSEVLEMLVDEWGHSTRKERSQESVRENPEKKRKTGTSLTGFTLGSSISNTSQDYQLSQPSEGR